MNNQKSFLSVLIFLFSLISLSFQTQYLIATNDDVNYVVTETEICILGVIYTCEGDKVILRSYDNQNCEGENFVEKEMDCSNGLCECSDKIPEGNRLEMFKDESCKEPLYVSFVLNDDDCFSLSFSDFKNSILEISGNKFNFVQFPGDGCIGQSVTLYKGSFGECISQSGQSVKMFSSGSLSTSSSLLLSSFLVVISLFLML